MTTSKLSFHTEAPAKRDAFAGQAHQRIACQLKQLIENDGDNKYPLLALEGDLGSGKSSVIALLIKQLTVKDANNSIKTFSFDCFQHHHVTLRKAFIEQFSDWVQKEIFQGDEEKIQAIEKIRDKALGRYFEYTKNVKSRLSLAAVWLLFATPFAIGATTSLFRFISEKGLSISSPGFYWPLIVASLPIWIFAIAWLKHRKTRNWNIGHILSGSSLDKVQETIEVEKEVSPQSLKTAFGKIIDQLKKDHPLIIVIDNIDRLDSHKLLEAWGDLEIFAATVSENKGHSIHFIVPFAKVQILKLLEQNTDRDQSLSLEFIHKRFPVIYRVAPIVFSDNFAYFSGLWREVFQEQYPEATIRHCFTFLEQLSLIKPLTPRLQKHFINDLSVTIHTMTGVESIHPLAAAFYLLTVQYYGLDLLEILSLPSEDESVASRFYPSKQELVGQMLAQHIDTEHGWPAMVAAIHYQVDQQRALQIVLDEPIQQAIEQQDIEGFLKLQQSIGFDRALERVLNLSTLKGQDIIFTIGGVLHKDSAKDKADEEDEKAPPAQPQAHQIVQLVNKDFRAKPENYIFLTEDYQSFSDCVKPLLDRGLDQQLIKNIQDQITEAIQKADEEFYETEYAHVTKHQNYLLLLDDIYTLLDMSANQVFDYEPFRLLYLVLPKLPEFNVLTLNDFKLDEERITELLRLTFEITELASNAQTMIDSEYKLIYLERLAQVIKVDQFRINLTEANEFIQIYNRINNGQLRSDSYCYIILLLSSTLSQGHLNHLKAHVHSLDSDQVKIIFVFMCLKKKRLSESEQFKDVLYDENNELFIYNLAKFSFSFAEFIELSQYFDDSSNLRSIVVKFIKNEQIRELDPLDVVSNFEFFRNIIEDDDYDLSYAEFDHWFAGWHSFKEKSHSPEVIENLPDSFLTALFANKLPKLNWIKESFKHYFEAVIGTPDDDLKLITAPLDSIQTIVLNIKSTSAHTKHSRLQELINLFIDRSCQDNTFNYALKNYYRALTALLPEKNRNVFSNEFRKSWLRSESVVKEAIEVRAQLVDVWGEYLTDSTLDVGEQQGLIKLLALLEECDSDSITSCVTLLRKHQSTWLNPKNWQDAGLRKQLEKVLDEPWVQENLLAKTPEPVVKA